MPPATVGEYYEEPVTFFMPEQVNDPGSGVTATLLEVQFTNVSGIPFGMEYTLNDADSTFFPSSGENYGCATVCGVPVLPGVYTITISVNVVASAFGIEINQVQNFSQVFIVNPGEGGTNSFTYDALAGCGSLVVNFDAALEGSAQQVTTYSWNFGNGETSNSGSPAPVVYDAVGDYNVTLQTIISDFVLTQVTLSSLANGWGGDIEDLFGSPDPYFTISNSSATVYTSPTINDVATGTWNGLNLLLNSPPYTITFWDEDLITQDDQLGSAPLSTAIGFNTFSSGTGTNGQFTIASQAVNTITDEITVSVFPIPNASLSFNGTQLVCADANLASYAWTVEGQLLENESSPILTLQQGGEYVVFVANEFGCQAQSEPYLYCPPIVPVFNENLDVLSVPQGFLSYAWFFNGLPLANQNSYFINNPENGNYAVEVTTAYGCTILSAVSIVNVGIEERQNVTFGMYPNPVNDVLSFEWSFGKRKAILFDLNGRVVSERVFLQGENQWNLSQLASGLYRLRIIEENGAFGEKGFVKN